MPIRDSLRSDLAAARKAKGTEMVSLIRTLIAAVENAEAVDPADAVGVSETPRRQLSDDDIVSIIRNEVDDLRQAATNYDRRGHEREAERLHSLSVVADRYAKDFLDSRT